MGAERTYSRPAPRPARAGTALAASGSAPPCWRRRLMAVGGRWRPLRREWRRCGLRCHPVTALVFCRLALQARLPSFAALLSWQAAAAVAPSPLTAEGLTAVPGRARVVKMLGVEGAPASPAGVGRSDACGGSLRAGD